MFKRFSSRVVRIQGIAVMVKRGGELEGYTFETSGSVVAKTKTHKWVSILTSSVHPYHSLMMP